MSVGSRSALSMVLIGTLILVSGGSLANIAVFPEPEIVNSQGPIGEPGSVHLHAVDLTIDLYDDHIEGKGKYSFKNLGSNESTLSLFFDPSYYPRSLKILVDGIDVATRTAVLDDSYYSEHDVDRWETAPYEVTVFDVTIPGNGSLEALVEWESGSSTKTREVSSGEPRKFLEKDKTESIITEWGTSYLVLSNSSWTRPISSFSIQFVCHSSRFRDPLVGMTIVPTHEGVIGDHHIKGTVDRFRVSDDYTDQVQTAIGTDQNGDSTYTITIKDWHEGDSYIRCRGSSETDVIEKADTYFYIELGSLIGAIGLFLLFITVLIIRRKRKR